jgi:hypothetical protein
MRFVNGRAASGFAWNGEAVDVGLQSAEAPYPWREQPQSCQPLIRTKNKPFSYSPPPEG